MVMEVDASNRLAKYCYDMLTQVDSKASLLSEKLVSQKRRVMMKDCIRIIYYCHVQRSSGCRYEMSVCVPYNPEEKLRIDDFNVHTCNTEDTKLRRRAKPQVEDFDKPIEKRKAQPSGVPSGKDDFGTAPYLFGDSVTNFLNGLNDHLDADNDFEAEQSDFGYSPELGVVQNDNLVKFISELGHDTKSMENVITSRPGPSTVWATVEVDVVDFSKRPDPPFTHVFHARDEVASQFSYASPMIGDRAELVAEELLRLFYLFGSSRSAKLDAIYRGTVLEKLVSERFPTLNLIFQAENRNQQGTMAPRRQESIIRERIYAWLLENDKMHWHRHLTEIKYMHNSEWIDELGGTPMEMFFGRMRSPEIPRKRKADVTIHDDNKHNRAQINKSNGTTSQLKNVSRLYFDSNEVKVDET
ncbi:hypothetical protein DICVIV_00411 [Dictyocaulus viviparus]|uniref:Uncharacterized protein n=1 Tax=Dictyocaulus viviparus TaxID=29172 RepID=A0A0D8Y8Y1_DICVI|nr:hypothetical protein DICVIV_00411 [Dictyocaulus viviparus]